MLVWFIYALVDPETEIVRYIGHTNNPTARFWHHLGLKTSATSQWIAALKLKNLKPKFEILEHGIEGDHLEAEQKWILHFRSAGMPVSKKLSKGSDLLNIEDGRVDKVKMAESTRQKMRLAKLGKKQSPEMIEARRRGLLGHTVSAETREKIAASKRGKPRDETTRQKLSDAARAYYAKRREQP